MLGGATQAMPLCIVEERQRRRRPLAATPLRAAAPRPAGCVARSLHTTPGMLVARALPASLGASSKVQMSFCGGPLCRGEAQRALRAVVAPDHEPGFQEEAGGHEL